MLAYSRKNGRKSSRRNSRNNRKSRRNTRKQRGGASTDGGYGMPQQYYNPSMFSTRTEVDSTSMSSLPTATDVRPTMYSTVPANYDAINGVGAVPKAMVGGRRKIRKNRKNNTQKKNSRRQRK
jgi:hypothetical protein